MIHASHEKTWSVSHILKIPGLFDREYRFVLIDQGNSPLFKHGETFKGVLV